MTAPQGNRFLKYVPHLLDALRSTDPLPMRPAAATEWIRQREAVSEDDLTRRIENGQQTIFENDVHWARYYLAEAGMLSRAKRGWWSLTPEGRKAHLNKRSSADLFARVRSAGRMKTTAEDTTPAPASDVEKAAPSFWFAGAIWNDNQDQTERFLADGVWVNGYDDQFKEVVARMKPGDRIAIKSSFVQKHGLPFDVGGASVSCMRIKATGTITGNRGDGKTVTVKWDAQAKPRDWYFYTYRTTLVEADSEDERGLRLINFTFGGEAQEYAWWLQQPYWAKKYANAQGKRSLALVGSPDDDDVDDGLPDENALTYTLDDIVDEGCFVPRDVLQTMLERWREKKNLILQGPPGTGKTFLAKRLGYALIGSKDHNTSRARLRVVQFHPSLSYEDFVRGWRPKGKEGLDLVDGIFMQSIDAARSEPDREYVLVIEEINRGNPAQIFGEMLTLMEAGKRRREDAIDLAYRRTADERVFVPENLYVIGTMNVADRSLALVDMALRRRFAFVDLEPRLGAQWRAWCDERGVVRAVAELIEGRIAALNKQIAEAPSLGPQFRVGHSYVTPNDNETVADARGWFRGKVETEIGPLLDEYWYDAPELAKKARADLVAGI